MKPTDTEVKVETGEAEDVPCESEESCELKPIETTSPEVWDEPAQKEDEWCEDQDSCELDPIEPTSLDEQ